MDISSYLRRVARGKHGAEHLKRQEAADVLAALLAPDGDALQLGAFLIAERMKGETSAELAGFVDAVRTFVDGFGEIHAPQGTVDLPCYAGKRRAAPAHLAAALKARDAGIPLLVHGVEQINGRFSAWQALDAAGVQRAQTLADALQLLKNEGIAYIDLQQLCPPLFGLFALRSRLGVRSFAHTVARLLNPLRCDGQLNGVFHTPYVLRMAETNALLNQKRSLVFMGAEGEPELYAARQKGLVAQQGKAINQCRYPDAACDAYPKLAEANQDVEAGFSVLLEGGGNTREHAVMARMQQAFELASTGAWPTDWQED